VERAIEDHSDHGEIAEADVVTLLANPQAYPWAMADVAVIETHCARVFLAGPEALKVKKRVRLPFLDFTTLEARRRACTREVELNQPCAPNIYLGIIPITLEKTGQLAIAGVGEVVDWAVRMRRFDQDDLLAHIIEKGPLAPTLSRSLAAMVTRYHRTCPISQDHASGSMRSVVRRLVDKFETAKELIGAEVAAIFGVRATAEIDRIAGLLDQRAGWGAFRRCHGDLHLGNIVRDHNQPVPFDALEFDEALATIDVLYDLSFLLMDLEQHGDRHAANIVLNDYCFDAPVGHEIEGLACLPLFLACRAAIRTIVAVERTRQMAGAEATGEALAATHLAASANWYLNPPKPMVLAVGGLSGTGKSTLAASLAPHLGAAPGAIHLRSDLERKRLAGVAETIRLGAEHYRMEATERVYEVLEDKASCVVASGHSVVVDAVFSAPEERTGIAAVAERCGCTFMGLWLEAPADTLLSRVAARRGDASDADTAVVGAQLSYDVGEITWQRIPAADAPAEVLARALSHMKYSVCGPRAG
jgi:aminoglycoside phosphotransferase family enzyme/predicted kinase